MGCKPLPTFLGVPPSPWRGDQQVDQIKRVGFSAAAIGIGEEYDEDEEKVTNSERKLVLGSLYKMRLTSLHDLPRFMTFLHLLLSFDFPFLLTFLLSRVGLFDCAIANCF